MVNPPRLPKQVSVMVNASNCRGGGGDVDMVDCCDCGDGSGGENGCGDENGWWWWWWWWW